MGFSIYAQDNEFAVATGSNVNSGPGVSDFDYPPTSSLDLVVSTNDADADPRLFEVGDTYDLSFGGAGGFQSIADATVIRSDAAPGVGGVVVFEGLDQNGNLTQVVWTPDFDLQTWYFDNFTNGQPPQFYTSDQDAAYSHAFVCFDAQARIATPDGARAAGDIRVGDPVITVDRGAQPVRWVGRRTVVGHGISAPVQIRTGVLGNTAPLRLSQQHRVVLRSGMAELLFGAQEVLVPIRALIDDSFVQLSPCTRITYVHLMLDRHEILLAENAPCESLFCAPEWAGIADAMPQSQHIAARPILTYREARSLNIAQREAAPHSVVVL